MENHLLSLLVETIGVVKVFLLSTLLLVNSTFGALELSPRVVFTKQTQWQGILGPSNLRGYGFSPGQYHPGVEIFRGIPYASPPISQLRYESPAPIALLSNKTYIANQTKPPCPKQFESLNVYKGPDPFRRIKSNLNQDALEDCLYLDVYAPRISQKRSGSGLPVLVYANSHADDPEDPFDGSSVAAIGNVIVVRFSYRVGVLGFLHPGYSEDIRSNFGLWDQLAALQWIRENINGFGGDENNVSLMGLDLDAAFIGVLALSPLSQAYGGLFHRLILLNGSPLSPLSINQRPLTTTAHMARALKCPMHKNDGELGRCLRQRQLDQLLGAAHNMGFSLFNNHFAPSVDGTMVKDILGNANSVFVDEEALKELLSRYDILCGLAEGTILPNIGQPSVWQTVKLDSFVTAVLKLALQLEPDVDPPELLQDELRRALINEYGDPYPFMRDILADFLTVFPMTNLLNLHSQTRKNTFFYVSKNYNPLAKTKVRPKNNDVSYIFSNSVYKWKYIDYGQPNADLQPYELLITFIANFVRSGDPNVQNPRERFSTRTAAWPKYRPEMGNYLRFGRVVEADSKYRRRSMDFWQHAFPAILKNALTSEQLNQRSPVLNPRFPSHFPGRGTVFEDPEGTATPENVRVISTMTQNTVVMVGGFLLALNLLCFIGLFYQRQRLKRAELRLRNRRVSETNSETQNGIHTQPTQEMTTTSVREDQAIPSEPSEPYGYIGPAQLSQPSQPVRAPLDTMSETETDNGFGTDFLGPNYDPRTKVTRWMFQQNRNGSGGGSFERSDQTPEQIPMNSMVPYSGTLPRSSAPVSHQMMTTALMTQPPYYNHPFQPSVQSDIPYADSRATSPSVANYNYRPQPPPPGFNNNLITNNFNHPRRSFAPSPSHSGTTTLSNPESQSRRSKAFFPLQNSVIVQEVDLEEYPNTGDSRLVVTDDLEVQSSRPKLVPVKSGTLTRSVGVGDTEATAEHNGAEDESLPLLSPSANPVDLRTSSPSGSNKQSQKVKFADES